MANQSRYTKKSSTRITKSLLNDAARGKKSAYDAFSRIGSRAIPRLLTAMQGPFPPEIHGRDALENITCALSRAAKHDAGPLIEAIRSGDLYPDPYLWLAYSALGKSRDKHATEVLIEGLSSPKAFIREMTLSQLCRRRTPGLIEHLLPRICDRSSDVCFTAVSEILKNPEYRDPRAIPCLKRLLERKRLAIHSPGLVDRAKKAIEKIESEHLKTTVEHLDLSHEQISPEELRENLSRNRPKALDLGDAEGVDQNVIETVSEASDLEELNLESMTSREMKLASLGKLSSLKKLKLGNLSLVGDNAKVLAQFPQLTHLDLSGTTQDDDDLQYLANCKNLKHLTLDFRTTDEGLKRIRHFIRLEWLFVMSGFITSDGLKYLKRMKRLKFLRFHYSNIGEGSLEDLLALPRLEVLIVYGAKITNEGMKNIGKMKQLRWLDLGLNQITDRGVKALKSLKQLEALDLGNNKQVTDESIETLVKLPLLRQLIYHNTRITKDGRKRLLSVHPECQINGMKLSIPVET